MRGAGPLQMLRLKVRSYIPDFKLAFEHFCIHTGGRGVIDAIEKQLELLPENVAPSRETLFRYGNVSSSSIWCAPQAGPASGARFRRGSCHPLVCRALAPAVLGCFVQLLSNVACCAPRCPSPAGTCYPTSRPSGG